MPCAGSIGEALRPGGLRPAPTSVWAGFRPVVEGGNGKR